MLAGTLPASWTQGGAFPSLSSLHFHNVSITGSLPASWGSSAALTDLQLNFTKLSGALSTEWGTPKQFQNLETLHIVSCNINGVLSILFTDAFIPIGCLLLASCISDCCHDCINMCLLNLLMTYPYLQSLRCRVQVAAGFDMRMFVIDTSWISLKSLHCPICSIHGCCHSLLWHAVAV